MELVQIIFQNPSILIAILVLFSMAVFYLCLKLAFKKDSEPKEPLFSEDEISSLCRVDNLFEEVTPLNGHEWKELPVDNLIKICVEASEIVGKEDDRNTKRFLIQTAEKAEDLSSWMEANKDRDSYKDSDMSYLIKKSKVLAFSLRSRAGNIP